MQTFYLNVPPGMNDLDVSFNAPDHAGFFELQSSAGDISGGNGLLR